MRVSVEIFEEEVDGDSGLRDGIVLICERCGHRVEVYGTSDGSACRGAYMLREMCLEGESNFYDVGW